MSDTNSQPADDTQKPAGDTQAAHLPDVTSDEFDEFTKEGYTFIDCWAAWCQPCKMVEPTIEKISEEWKNKIKFGKLNTDENADTAMKFNIFGIPTFLLFKDGQLVDRLTGLNPPQVFSQFLARNYVGDDVAKAA